jgi:hypothetical protein
MLRKRGKELAGTLRSDEGFDPYIANMVSSEIFGNTHS